MAISSPSASLFFLFFSGCLFCVAESSGCVGLDFIASKPWSRILPDEKEVWYCPNGTSHVIVGDQRYYLSPCERGQVEINTECVAPSHENVTLDCPSRTPPPGAFSYRHWVYLPNYIKYYICEPHMIWASGAVGQFSQCLNGEWTPIHDFCVPDCSEGCTVPRDCSMISRLGFNTSGLYYVKFSGNENAYVRQVWCDLSSSDPNEDGWTTLLQFGLNTDGVELKRTSKGTPGPRSSNQNYFIGARELTPLAWEEDMNTERPLVFRFQGILVNNSEEFHATYNGIRIELFSDFELLSVGSYHGTPGEALSDSVGGEVRRLGHFWLTTDDDQEKVIFQEDYFQWQTYPLGERNLNHIFVSFRPEDFDREFSCPPNVYYSPFIRSAMPIHFPMERTEGTIINYNCTSPYTGEVITSFIECKRDENGSLFWNYTAPYPCEYECPVGFTKNWNGEACLNFSVVPAAFGVSSASLVCSREHEASLAKIEDAMDLETAAEGLVYYTAHVSQLGTLQPAAPPSAVFECGLEPCSPSGNSMCLSVSKLDNTTYEQNIEHCYDQQIHYVCQLPAICPPDFYHYRGLCYRLISDYGGRILDALQECKRYGASLAYPETTDVIEFFKRLCWSREKSDDFFDNIDPTAEKSYEDNFIIGLNSVYDDWSGGLEYAPDDAMIRYAGVSAGFGYYRYVHFPSNWSEEVELMHTNYYQDGITNVQNAICQLHAPSDCWEDPPEPSENMERIWNGDMDVGDTATYRCYPGYYMENLTYTREQEFECRGPLGGWMPVGDVTHYNCTLMEVCDRDTVPCSTDPLIDLSASPDAFTFNSSIQYFCPVNKAFPDGSIEWNTTCVENTTAPPSFMYDPPILPECVVCTETVNVTNGYSDWSDSVTYTTDMIITVTCDDGYILPTDGAVTSVNVTCGALGWHHNLISLNCFTACINSPPTPGDNMTAPSVESYYAGAKLVYRCDTGLYVLALSPELKNYVVVTCGSDGEWHSPLTDAELYCTEMCLDDPLEPPEPGTTDWDGETRVVGTEVNIECPENQAFPDLNTSLVLKCESGGSWEPNITYDDILCRRYATELPKEPNGTEYTGPPSPYWQGAVLNFTCINDTITLDGETWTTVTFNGTGWIYDDPDFECVVACIEALPEALTFVELRQDGPPVEGSVVTYVCQGEFLNGDTEFNITCESGIWSANEVPMCLYGNVFLFFPFLSSVYGKNIDKLIARKFNSLILKRCI